MIPKIFVELLTLDINHNSRIWYEEDPYYEKVANDYKLDKGITSYDILNMFRLSFLFYKRGKE